ncbi:glyoxalase/bleomycin resistance protein/dioxygenase [Eremomyces bilateralis CBS 781.70]|uniref:Glyoxalase/bleomycin resistance protein/dioxygenase n=1 Tax=Eremomyces bilateralis CBS 781.70 TaxID=1392243 RepID=A0A6G1G6S7_9PEZI|nr:glyoxalase/bleomycin resistance protein/dioxygenase [Eremomyces bilateralis CBS 781.70]KAF1813636.1 glyoxalase/bleomycin resistance protein/dioxygenase [Eremomyces bilateralis CBS 781.70]
MAIDHTSISVPKAQYAEVLAFYEKALAPLGYTKMIEYPFHVAGLGAGKPDFWITGKDGEAGMTNHTAFTANDHECVDKFHAAAVAAGGVDNGAPGPRPQYHEKYYGAFVKDPAGNNIEAVSHA